MQQPPKHKTETALTVPKPVDRETVDREIVDRETVDGMMRLRKAVVFQVVVASVAEAGSEVDVRIGKQTKNDDHRAIPTSHRAIPTSHREVLTMMKADLSTRNLMVVAILLVTEDPKKVVVPREVLRPRRIGLNS